MTGPERLSLRFLGYDACDGAPASPTDTATITHGATATATIIKRLRVQVGGAAGATDEPGESH